eukprot:TRINITY_DN56671_c0_g1_i1.p1 TRINITY_DN56671_c0_g1~~TRINITY_DN56671_c0_g1_i1.p1  ORF type:complete len:328 (+),score=52.14 TRINITY_DN56671_c0_g1_i1:45-986(+)
MVHFAIFVVSVALAQESPRLAKYDECVRTPQKAQDALLMAQPSCKRKDAYCKKCLPTLIDLLDAQEGCCDALKEPLDDGLRKDAYLTCKNAIPDFKAAEFKKCEGMMFQTDAGYSAKRFNTCMKSVIDAETAIYTAHPVCNKSRPEYCSSCFQAFLSVTSTMEECCSLLNSEMKPGADTAAHAACLTQAAEKKDAIRSICPRDTYMTGASASAVAKATQCYDVSWMEPKEEYKDCKDNIVWAQGIGMWNHPEYYKNYPFLGKYSSIHEFQQVLYLMEWTSSGQSYKCPMPCTLNGAAMAFVKKAVAEVESIQA